MPRPWHRPASGAALPIEDVAANARFDLMWHRRDAVQAWGDLLSAPIRIELATTRSVPAAAPSAG
jgi:hypothetical protein